MFIHLEYSPSLALYISFSSSAVYGQVKHTKHLILYCNIHTYADLLEEGSHLIRSYHARTCSMYLASLHTHTYVQYAPISHMNARS